MNGTPITMVQALMLHGFIHYAPVRISDLTEDVMCVLCSSRQVFRCRSLTEKLRFRSKNINVRFKVAQVAMTQDLSPSIRVSSDSIIPTMFHIYSPHPTLATDGIRQQIITKKVPQNCLPNVFARGSLLASKNSHGSSQSFSRKYGVSR